MSARCLVAIDPGSSSGALSFYFPSHPNRIHSEDLPVVNREINGAALAERLRLMDPEIGIVEIASSMPRQGIASAFRYGNAYGVINGVAAALQIPIHRVSPQRWKKHFKLSSDKELSRGLAIRLFPACAHHFARKSDHNRAESALLAKFLSETLGLERPGAEP
jgi:crossover junction endodeoxyribonuclease RuvC